MRTLGTCWTGDREVHRPSLDVWAWRECAGPLLWAEYEPDPETGLGRVLIAPCFDVADRQLLIVDRDERWPTPGRGRGDQLADATWSLGVWRITVWLALDPTRPDRLYALVKMMPSTLDRIRYEQPDLLQTLTHGSRRLSRWHLSALVNTWLTLVNPASAG